MRGPLGRHLPSTSPDVTPRHLELVLHVTGSSVVCRLSGIGHVSRPLSSGPALLEGDVVEDFQPSELYTEGAKAPPPSLWYCCPLCRGVLCDDPPQLNAA